MGCLRHREAQRRKRSSSTSDQTAMARSGRVHACSPCLLLFFDSRPFPVGRQGPASWDGSIHASHGWMDGMDGMDGRQKDLLGNLLVHSTQYSELSISVRARVNPVGLGGRQIKVLRASGATAYQIEPCLADRLSAMCPLGFAKSSARSVRSTPYSSNSGSTCCAEARTRPGVPVCPCGRVPDKSRAFVPAKPGRPETWDEMAR